MNTNQAGKLCILYPLQNFPDFINRIQAQIAFNRSDFSPNNQRQIYEDFGIKAIFERFLNKNRVIPAHCQRFWHFYTCALSKMLIFAA